MCDIDMENDKEIVNDNDDNIDDDDNLAIFFDQENQASQQIPFTPKLQTDELTVKRLYLLGRIISRVFKDNDIPYWATGGTLLGCVRHKGLIPWDDDIDISVMETHQQKLEQMTDVLLDNQLVLTDTFFGFRLHHRIESKFVSETAKYGMPFCDITIMRHNRKNRTIELKHQSARDLWKNEFYLPAEVECLQEMIYGDFEFLAPSDPLPYLFRFYGDDCLGTGKSQNYDHETRLPVKSVVIDTPKGFEPARPFH